MKRLFAAAVIASVLVLGASAARAEELSAGATGTFSAETDQYEDAFTNPMRLIYYVAYPIGFTAEWLVFRPFHYIISRPYLDKFFGYVPISEEGAYRRLGERM